MGDIKSYPPRQAAFSIPLPYRDVAHLMMQGCEMPEVLSFLDMPSLERLLNNLNAEHQDRTEGKNHESQATKDAVSGR